MMNNNINVVRAGGASSSAESNIEVESIGMSRGGTVTVLS
jgi:hypothetical protein